jgi:hypothetical protein
MGICAYCLPWQVQGHWYNYTQKMDRMVEEAFRLNVKYSLQELSKAINGDGKSAPNPLFRVKVVLEGDKVSQGYLNLNLNFLFKVQWSGVLNMNSGFCMLG